MPASSEKHGVARVPFLLIDVDDFAGTGIDAFIPRATTIIRTFVLATK